jgi:hypothetical protein
VEESIAPALDGAVLDIADPHAGGQSTRFKLIPPERE